MLRCDHGRVITEVQEGGSSVALFLFCGPTIVTRPECRGYFWAPPARNPRSCVSINSSARKLRRHVSLDHLRLLHPRASLGRDLVLAPIPGIATGPGVDTSVTDR